MRYKASYTSLLSFLDVLGKKKRNSNEILSSIYFFELSLIFFFTENKILLRIS